MARWMQEKEKTVANECGCKSFLARAIDDGNPLFYKWCCCSLNSPLFIGGTAIIFPVELTLKCSIPCRPCRYIIFYLFVFYDSKNSDVSQDDALKYGTAILIITISSGICVLHYFYFAFYYGARLRVAVCSLIYRKVYLGVLSNHYYQTMIIAMVIAVVTAITKRFERYGTWKTS